MTKADRETWKRMRARRMSETGAAEAYDAAKLAFELGVSVRQLRERRGWTQARLAEAAGMTQPAVARFEAGGTIPTIQVLERLANALDARLEVRLTSPTSAA